MATVAVVNNKKEKVDEVNLREDIFNVPVKVGLLHQVVRWQMARWRAGTACTKTRGEVRGGGRKPWRQKGTGRARQGSIRAPHWVGGGVVFGPKPRDYEFKVNKKERRLALKMALSARAQEGKLLVVDDFGLDEIKTKKFLEFLRHLDAEDALVVLPERDEVVEKSARNLPTVKVLTVDGLNVYDILDYEYLIIKREALPKIEERLSR
ncbi:50S ribosomal protein L4 [Thermodesulfatator autotrophicus]|uniref:Large ribosomal subunit protein uL4 n=1 Tax=Thermodesulfatator autotrophicus TaxID=1795632 RepID=A0A177E6W4_9BACT|nr:50S ribosomal protein L4 [Thermodesulfatator autotrophicus]OAG27241.1 50S ribosomal protein L4 [Thermodesulfatator autotrophicus]